MRTPLIRTGAQNATKTLRFILTGYAVRTVLLLQCQLSISNDMTIADT